MVFKNPPEGCTHVFRPGEPFMQMLIIPAEPQFELVEMDFKEAAEREMRGRRIHASRETLAKDTTWFSSTNTVFDAFVILNRLLIREGRRTLTSAIALQRLPLSPFRCVAVAYAVIVMNTARVIAESRSPVIARG